MADNRVPEVAAYNTPGEGARLVRGEGHMRIYQGEVEGNVGTGWHSMSCKGFGAEIAPPMHGEPPPELEESQNYRSYSLVYRLSLLKGQHEPYHTTGEMVNS